MTATATAETTREIEIGPQEGFQFNFLASRADVTIGGGAAGVGKTYAELLAVANYLDIVGFTSVFFRKTLVEIKKAGGIWDESYNLYPLLGANDNASSLTWTWPSGANVSMGHLENDAALSSWQGSQIALILFDELTHFTEKQFFYMLSRNRSVSGVKPRVMATCNPDADSWVAKFIEWWIDQNEFLPDGSANPNYGLPIEERAGVLRYMARVAGEIKWADTREELAENPAVIATIESVRSSRKTKTVLTWEQARDVVIKSVTFIPGKLEENVILEEANPGYRGNLLMLDRVEQARLLGGNWKIRASAGTFFRKHEVTMIDGEPDDIIARIRRWDLAASEPTKEYPDPDWTCGVLIGKRKNGRYVILDCIMVQKREGDVRDLILRTAINDTRRVTVGLPQDPGQAGKGQLASYVKLLAGFVIVGERETGDKATRCKPLATQWQHNNIDVVRGPWNDQYFAQMEPFPTKGIHDDAPDATAGGFNHLVSKRDMSIAAGAW